MKEFASLITDIDQTNKTNEKINALVDFFEKAPEEDKLWAIALLIGKKPKRAVNATQLRLWAAERSNIPDWLFEESYHVVGDLSETIALLLPEPEEEHNYSLKQWMKLLAGLSDKGDAQKKEEIVWAWSVMNQFERFVFNKVITGGFRIGVSQQSVVKALSKYTGFPSPQIAHRLMGNWDPMEDSFSTLLLGKNISDDISRPYPFYLAYQIENKPEELGDPKEWQVEWKWDGIRGQVIKREGEIFVWSRGEELVTERFPELRALKEELPDGTVLDGEILAFKGDKPLPFNYLQTRIGRKQASKKLLEEVPVLLYAYDILEFKGEDIRAMPLKLRRKVLMELVNQVKRPDKLRISEVLKFSEWEELYNLRALARDHYSEGLMLKKLSSPYETGRRKGNWWKWKIDPYTIDAVLTYSQPGHGRRAGLYTDHTFAVWKDAELITFTKAYSGLTDKEIIEVDRLIRQNTIEKFGPVRSVKPFLVFEIGFEGINRSSRHKSGLALRFPRILRWRRDKPAEEADTIENLQALLNE